MIILQEQEVVCTGLKKKGEVRSALFWFASRTGVRFAAGVLRRIT
ncbi:MAG: hypothetical protein WA904_20370 [Polaromonas sp.]